MTAKPCVFLHTNEKQIVGALVSAYSMHRNSKNADKFDVKILHAKDHPFLAAREGQSFLREGEQRVWRMEDLQSFTPLRFMPPEVMGYEGRAVVVDPDVFAVGGDPWELLSRDMQGKAILCCDISEKQKKGYKGRWASSVMLLDCAKLEHWRAQEQFAELFEGKRDYIDWIYLKLEPEDSIGVLESEWNAFDTLTENTRFLHNTRRATQPWKTGLPVDFTHATHKFKPARLSSWTRLIKQSIGGDTEPDRYRPHPDRRQEEIFFTLLKECVDQGIVTEEMLREEMRRDHVRHDAMEMIGRQAQPAA